MANFDNSPTHQLINSSTQSLGYAQEQNQQFNPSATLRNKINNSIPRLRSGTKSTIQNMSSIEEFNSYRERMNEKILSQGNINMKRLWALDASTYQEGALSVKTKEMMGLVASMVLRCDDCIKYHLGKCHELKVTTDEMYELFTVSNLVGGTIVIPHTRRAAEYWDELITSV
jgi:AhpD family alkylhydroperoxidase